MASIQKIDLVDIELNSGTIHREWLNHSIGLADNAANGFGVRVFRDHQPVDLTGVSIQGYFRDPQGTNIAITSGNSVSGNTAYVVLPQACYTYEGQFCLAIKLIGGGVTGTMRIVDGMIDNCNTSSPVAPTSTVPTYQEIIAQYDAMVAATAAANGAIAETYSQKTYAVGEYCIHDGGLYRCTTAITTAEAWNAVHWTATKIGPDVSDVKSAIDQFSVDVIDNWQDGKYYPCNSGFPTVDISSPASNSGYSCCYVPCKPGDIFYYKGEGSSLARPYAFLSSASGENNKINFSSETSYSEQFTFHAPANASYVVFNKKNTSNTEIRKNKNTFIIVAGTDLNDLKTEGIYSCLATATAIGLNHIPDRLGTSFTMQVVKSTSSNELLEQIIYTNTVDERYMFVAIRFHTGTSGFSDWKYIEKGNSESLEIKDMVQLQSGSDLNDLYDVGSYYSPSRSVTATIANVPLAVDSGFYITVINTNGLRDNSYKRQMLYGNKFGYASIFTRVVNASGWGKWNLLVSADAVDAPMIVSPSNFQPYARLTGTPKKTIKVGTNNVAHYSYTGVDFLNTHPEKICEWRKWLLKANMDILFLQECEDYIDSEADISAFDTLYKPFFDNDTNIDDNPDPGHPSSGVENKARRKILNRLGLTTESVSVTVESSEENKNSHYNHVICSIEGVGKVLLIDVHTISGRTAARENGRKACLDSIQLFIQNNISEYDYFIIAGDFNTNSSTDYANLLNFCANINGIPANGGLLGWFTTISVEEQQDCFDNIIVSNNIRIESIESDPLLVAGGMIHTDHNPVTATLSFMEN